MCANKKRKKILENWTWNYVAWINSVQSVLLNKSAKLKWIQIQIAIIL